MARPYGLLRAGFPFHKTLGMRRLTNFPIDVAVGREGRLYILCRQEGTAAMIRKYTVEDEDLGEISKHGDGEGKMKWPACIIADSEENLYVSDEAMHRVISYDMEGEHRGTWGEHGSEPGRLDRPAGIAFDAEENVYVADAMNHRIQKFTKDGEYMLGWGGHGCGPGEFDMPYGVAVDDEGFVYVADWRNDRIQKFTADGEFVFECGGSGSGNGELNRPSGIDVDGHGDIYVADWRNDRVQLFNHEGRYVQKFLGDATLSKVSREYMLTNASPNRMRDMADLEPQKYLRRPKSVAVDENGLMFIPDNGSYRVQVYRKEAIPLTPQELAAPRRSPSLQQE